MGWSKDSKKSVYPLYGNGGLRTGNLRRSRRKKNARERPVCHSSGGSRRACPDGVCGRNGHSNRKVSVEPKRLSFGMGGAVLSLWPPYRGHASHRAKLPKMAVAMDAREIPRA